MFWDNTYRFTNEVRGRGHTEVHTEQHIWRVTFVGDPGQWDGEFRLARRRKRARVSEDWPTVFPATPDGMRQVIDTLEEAEIRAGGDPRRWTIGFPASGRRGLSRWVTPWQLDSDAALTRLFEQLDEEDDEDESLTSGV